MKTYEISMEIEGPFAMWSRPDTGSTPTSYPIPTWSAAKGIFESIAFLFDGAAWIQPVKVEVCRHINDQDSRGEIRFQKYTTNYRGPLKEKNKSNFQFSALVATNVCYRLYGVIKHSDTHTPGIHRAHQLQAMFERRLKKGQCHKTPCLGWSEFTPSYWGEFRDEKSNVDAREKTEKDEAFTYDMISMLHNVFDHPVGGAYAPEFIQGQAAIINGGEFTYAK